MKKEKIKLELEKTKKNLEDLNNYLKNLDVENKKRTNLKRAALCKLIAPHLLIVGGTLAASEIGGMGLPFYRDSFKNYIEKTTSYDSERDTEPKVNYKYGEYTSELDRRFHMKESGLVEYQTPFVPDDELYSQYEFQYFLRGKSSEELVSLAEFTESNYNQNYETISSLLESRLGKPDKANVITKTTLTQEETEAKARYSIYNTETDKNKYIIQKEDSFSNYSNTLLFIIFISGLEYLYLTLKKDSIAELIMDINNEPLTKEQIIAKIELDKIQIANYEQKLIKKKAK